MVDELKEKMKQASRSKSDSRLSFALRFQIFNLMFSFEIGGEDLLENNSAVLSALSIRLIIRFNIILVVLQQALRRQAQQPPPVKRLPTVTLTSRLLPVPILSRAF